MRSWPRQLLLRSVIKESCILHYYHTNSGPSLSRVVPHGEGTIFCVTNFIVSWNGRKMKTTDRVASNWGTSERWSFAQLKFHNDIYFILIVWTYKKNMDTTLHTSVNSIVNTKVKITIQTTRYQRTYQHTHNRPYHQIPMYILTYIQLSIPLDTNVHINIHTTVHTTTYQCTY